MPRKLRDEAPGQIVHVYARGNNGQAIFEDEEDRLRYFDILSFVIDDTAWECLAYCQMTNHIHLVIRTPRPNLALGMCWTHGSYARIFNQRHGRRHHVFGERYGATVITEPQHLWFAIAYVALNPVKAGLCDTPAAWPWSSHAAMIGAAPAPWWWASHEALAAFAALGDPDPAHAYADFVTRIGRERGVSIREPVA